MELSKTDFDIDLDSYDTEIPWLKSISSALYLSCVPSPNDISKSVQSDHIQKSTGNKDSIDHCERNDVKTSIRWNWMTGQFEQFSFNDSSHPLNELCDKPFVCQICQRTFTRMCNLTSHKRTHIAKPKSKPKTKFHKFNNIIPIEDIVPPPTALERQQGHCRRLFCQTETGHRYICTACGKHFSLMNYLRTHKKIHTGIGLHWCQFCQKSFTLKHALEV